MATYGKDTNWSNQEKYLTNLINTGSSGNKAWAQNELNKLNQAKAQYSTPTTNVSGSNVPGVSSAGSTGTNTSSTKNYTIGSSAGIQAANNLTAGGSFTASDGSVWTKGDDGKITVNKGGTTYNGVFDYNNIDYTKEIQNAVASGNYGLASQLESQRNDKIDWLNQSNGNTGNYGKTNQYGNYNLITELPDNWTSAVVGGNKYTRDETGRMYNDAGTLLGDGYNAVTNEFTFTDDNDAINSMFRSLKTQHGLENYSDEDAINYLREQGVWNTDYFNAFKNGTVSEYNTLMQQKAREEEERLAALAELEEAKRQYEEQLRLQREEEQRKMDEWLAELEKINQQKATNKNAYTDFIKSRLRKNFIY